MTAITRRTLLAATAAAIGSSAIAQNPMRWRFAHPHPDSDSWSRLRNSSPSSCAADGRRPRGAGLREWRAGQRSHHHRRGPRRHAGYRADRQSLFHRPGAEAECVDLPFLFRDRRHVAAVLDGEIGRGLLGELEAHGLTALGTWDIGLRNLTNSRRPVNEAGDMRGLKIRTTPNPAHIKAFQLLGAVPVPMAFTELFTAMETRAVDGQENPTTLIRNARFFEVQKHLSLTRHAYTAGILAMSKRRSTPSRRSCRRRWRRSRRRSRRSNAR